MLSFKDAFLKDKTELQIKQTYGAGSGRQSFFSRFFRHTMHLSHKNYQILHKKEPAGEAQEMTGYSAIPYWARSYYIGRRRPMKIAVSDFDKNTIMYIQRPFYLLNSTSFVFDDENQNLAVIQRRFNPMVRKYEILTPRKQLIAYIQAPISKPWTFPIYNPQKQEIGKITKQFPSLGEYMSYRETLNINFRNMPLEEKTAALAMALVLCIDIFGSL